MDTVREACTMLLLISLTLTAHAAVDEDWEAGKQAFANNDHQSALLYFESARDQGLAGPAVHYNIAVSQFKLGQYEAAGETFEFIAERFPSIRGLAEYNIGLVHQRLGNRSKAEDHFRKAYRLSGDDPKVRILASRQLRKTDREVRTASRWTGIVGVRGGFDDNVSLRDEAGLPTGVTSDSPMADVFATVQGPWSGASGFRVAGAAYLVRYFDADEFNQSQLRGDVFYDWRATDWRLRAGVHGSAGTLGSEAFDRKTGVNVRLLRYFGQAFSVNLAYNYDNITEGDTIFAPVAGSRQQIDTRLRWRSNGHGFQLRYWVESNDRDDPGLSADRYRLLAGYQYRPEAGFGFEGGIDFRTSEYAEAVIPREEDLTTLKSALTYRLEGNWLMTLEYRNSSNDSTDPVFSYDRSQILLGAMKVF